MSINLKVLCTVRIRIQETLCMSIKFKILCTVCTIIQESCVMFMMDEFPFNNS